MAGLRRSHCGISFSKLLIESRSFDRSYGYLDRLLISKQQVRNATVPNAVQLITYTDRLGGNIAGVTELLDNEFRGLFSGVHLLPFFEHIDGADAGFDPIDHTRVDPRIGDWSDITTLADKYSVMADMIVNHISADSEQFKAVCREAQNSKFWDLFLRRCDIFPNSDDESEEIRRIYRPRPGFPFTPIYLDSGELYFFWTTFSEKQIDINVESQIGSEYLTSIMKQFARSGVSEIRLDAAGYAIKRGGTSCFMLPETFDFISSLSEQAKSYGVSTLVEIHTHYRTQIEIASKVGRVYDFALPPLVLHAMYTSDAEPLRNWLAISPRNCVTVLDTHDGIGIHDVAAQGELDGLLADPQIDHLVETIHEKTDGNSRKASGQGVSNLDIYQVNSTYYDALGRNDTDYLLARAIQLFAPGIAQIYYVGLLAGENDMDLVLRTGVGRDINRHYYSPAEIEVALKRDVVKNLMKLIRFRKMLTALGGRFSLPECPPNSLIMRWDRDQAYAQLQIDLTRRCAIIDFQQSGTKGRININDRGVTEVSEQSENLMVSRA